MSDSPAPPAAIPITMRHYQALCALALVAIFLVQLQQSLSIFLNALILLLGVVGVLFRVRLSPLILFIAMAASQLIEQYSQNRFFNPDFRSFRFLDVGDVVLCLATLTYLVGQYRLHGLWFNVLPNDPRQTQPPHPHPLSPGGERETGQARTEKSMTPAELMWLVIPIPFFAVAAELFALALKQHWDLVGFPPRWRQFLAIAWLVLLVMFACAHAFRYWRRLHMDHASAQLLLQDVLWHETRGEQRRVNRWFAWRKVKQQEET